MNNNIIEILIFPILKRIILTQTSNNKNRKAKILEILILTTSYWDKPQIDHILHMIAEVKMGIQEQVANFAFDSLGFDSKVGKGNRLLIKPINYPYCCWQKRI